MFVLQQLLSLREQLAGKEAELEQARDEHRYLEGEVLDLRDKLGTERKRQSAVRDLGTTSPGLQLLNGDAVERTNELHHQVRAASPISHNIKTTGLTVCPCPQALNGAPPTLYPGRERRTEAGLRGGVPSEREALLLGKYEPCGQRVGGSSPSQVSLDRV